MTGLRRWVFALWGAFLAENLAAVWFGLVGGWVLGVQVATLAAAVVETAVAVEWSRFRAQCAAPPARVSVAVDAGGDGVVVFTEGGQFGRDVRVSVYERPAPGLWRRHRRGWRDDYDPW